MSDPEPLLAVPNVSEGRDAAVVSRIADAFLLGAELLDRHADARHNRTVLTLAAGSEPLAGCLARGAAEAVAAIDLRRHEGLHPRIGALDVCPVVYLDRDRRRTAREQALAAAEAIAALEVPVFLYGELASSPERTERAYFRRGGPAELARRLEAGELAPDLGPPALHPSAGGTLVTARPPLAAFNLVLKGATEDVAREVAAELREAGGGLPGVRAIGLDLGDGRTQISTNVHDPVAVPLRAVASRAAELAQVHHARIAAAEVVGLVPAAALSGFPEEIPLPGFDRERGVIEERLRSLG